MRVSGERYIAHELADPLLAGLVGWFAGMLHNQNNIVEEVSPVTSRLEKEVVIDIAKMTGLNADVWGHLTSGGTLASLEALWVARNKTYFPYAVEEFILTAKIGADFPVNPSVGAKNLGELIMLAMHDQRRSSDLYEELLRIMEKKYRGNREKGSRLLKRLWQEFGITGVGAKARNLPLGRVVTSKAAHYSISKALDLLGIGRKQFIEIDVDDNSRIDCAKLKQSLELSAKQGVRTERIIAVVANMGTTATGSIDPLDDIVRIRGAIEKQYKTSFILHADAAYGGYARLVDWGNPNIRGGFEIQRRFEAIRECESITVDPHKLGYVPYPCGSVLFADYRDKEFVRSRAPYLFHGSKLYKIEHLSQVDYLGQFTLEGSKPGSAATSAWLSHRIAFRSKEGYGDIITNNIMKTKYLETLIDRSDILQKVNSPELNVLCIRIKGRGKQASQKRTERIYRQLLDNHRTRDFVVSFEENDLLGPCFRVCILNPFTTENTLSRFVGKLEKLVLKN
jgi:glutamate/tyrosine decarboxylase-like PLP-dependent enzyme